MKPLLVAQSLTREEKGGKTPLIAEIDLTVNAGELVVLVGADGAGKTTLLRTLVGLLPPTKGEVLFDEKPLYVGKKPKADLLTQIGYMPQKFGLYTDLSVKENLTLFANLYGVQEKDREDRLKALLEVTGLTDFIDRMAGKLSGGMKQKLALACVLLNHPSLLVLDEPTVGVDPLSRKGLWSILKEYAQNLSMGIVVSTTLLTEADNADRVVMLDKGRLILNETPQSLKSRAQGLTWTMTLPTGVSLNKAQNTLNQWGEILLDSRPDGGSLAILVKPKIASSWQESLKASLPGAFIKAREATLEDGYLVVAARSTIAREAPIEKASVTETQPESTPVILAKDLRRTFGDFVAVSDTTFEVKRGEIFGLLGPNGAGKTTTFKMLCGLIEASRGRLTILEQNANHLSASLRRSMGYMAQKFALYGDLTVKENLVFFAQAYGLAEDEIEAQLSRLSALFDFGELLTTPTHRLEGGAKQRLSLAAALIHHPAILFLDEPTSGADVFARRAFWQKMNQLAAEGTTIIVTTHFMQEAEYCDRLMIIDAGKTLLLATPEAMRGASPSMDEAFIRVVNKARQREAS